jgi:hypothetical protein
LVQRAVLQYYDVDLDDPNSRNWPNGIKWMDTNEVLKLLTGDRTYVSEPGDLDTPEHLASFLAKGDILVTVPRLTGDILSPGPPATTPTST